MKRLLRLACILAAVVSSAPQMAPSQGDCSDLLNEMHDCMDYVMVGGVDTSPQVSCCSGFKTLVKANANCVCFSLNLAETLGLELDASRVNALPSICGVAAPSLAYCHIADSPVADSPDLSPVSDSPSVSPISDSPSLSPIYNSPIGSPAQAPITLPPQSAVGEAPAAASVSPAPAPYSSSSSGHLFIYFNYYPLFLSFLLICLIRP